MKRGRAVEQETAAIASGAPLETGRKQPKPPPESTGGKRAREAFLEGHRHEQPYVVQQRRRRVELDYMEKLLASSPPPSLSSLPTPAQLCRKRKMNQR